MGRNLPTRAVVGRKNLVCDTSLNSSKSKYIMLLPHFAIHGAHQAKSSDFIFLMKQLFRMQRKPVQCLAYQISYYNCICPHQIAVNESCMIKG